MREDTNPRGQNRQYSWLSRGRWPGGAVCVLFYQREHKKLLRRKFGFYSYIHISIGACKLAATQQRVGD